jgi:hypothetical protein
VLALVGEYGIALQSHGEREQPGGDRDRRDLRLHARDDDGNGEHPRHQGRDPGRSAVAHAPAGADPKRRRGHRVGDRD